MKTERGLSVRPGRPGLCLPLPCFADAPGRTANPRSGRERTRVRLKPSEELSAGGRSYPKKTLADKGYPAFVEISSQKNLLWNHLPMIQLVTSPAAPACP